MSELNNTDHNKGEFSERWKMKTQNIDKMQIDKKIFQIQSYKKNLLERKRIMDLFNSIKNGIDLNLSEDIISMRCNNLKNLQEEHREYQNKITFFETQVYPYLFPLFQEVVWKCLMDSNLESPYLSDYQKTKAKKIYDDIPDV